MTGLLSSTVLLAARDPDRDVLLDGSRTFFSSTGVAPHVMDDETGRRRAPTLADADAFTRLQDALDIVGLVSQVLSPASDDCDDLATLATMLGGTGKHLLLQLLDPEDVEPALEMVRLCAPQTDLVKRPLFSNIYCPWHRFSMNSSKRGCPPSRRSRSPGGHLRTDVSQGSHRRPRLPGPSFRISVTS